MRPEVIVHGLAQARLVLQAAEQLGIEVQLRSAPNALSHAGAGYLHALSEALGHDVLIDCSEDAGLAMAALRADCRKLFFFGDGEVLQRLRQMADQQNATIRSPKDPAPPCLSLSPDDDDRIVRPWLAAQRQA